MHLLVMSRPNQEETLNASQKKYKTGPHIWNICYLYY